MTTTRSFLLRLSLIITFIGQGMLLSTLNDEGRLLRYLWENPLGGDPKTEMIIISVGSILVGGIVTALFSFRAPSPAKKPQKAKAD